MRFLVMMFGVWASLAQATDYALQPALPISSAAEEQLLDITSAGSRVIAAGERGVIVYSDDGGRSWTQAKVPVSETLTSLHFPTADHGWAVGHGGVILHSGDGGETWQPAPGKRTAGWHAAAFTELNDGIVAGPRGRVSLVAGTNVAPPRLDTSSLRGIRAVDSSDGLTAFVVFEQSEDVLFLPTSTPPIKPSASAPLVELEVGRRPTGIVTSPVSDSAWV